MENNLNSEKESSCNELEKYRIIEEVFEDGRSKYTPQFNENGRFHDFYVFDRDYSPPIVSLRFDSYEDALHEINLDKKKSMKPNETITHKIY